MDDGDELIVSLRARWYTDFLITSALAAMNNCQNDIRLCRDRRRNLGSTEVSISPIPPDEEDDPDHLDIKKTLGMEGSEDDDWVFIKQVGSGGNGKVSFWARQDAAGNVVEKLAAKDCHWPPTSQIGWYDNGSEKRLREPFMHALLSTKDPEGSYTVLYRGSHTFESQNVVRIYMEFCSYGDMWGVSK